MLSTSSLFAAALLLAYGQEHKLNTLKSYTHWGERVDAKNPGKIGVRIVHMAEIKKIKYMGKCNPYGSHFYRISEVATRPNNSCNV